MSDIVTKMNHRSGVYDSPMAQDYYVRYLGGHLQPQPIPFYNCYNISLRPLYHNFKTLQSFNPYNIPLSYFAGGSALCLGEVAAGCTVCKRCSKLRTRCIFTKLQGRLYSLLLRYSPSSADVGITSWRPHASSRSGKVDICVHVTHSSWRWRRNIWLSREHKQGMVTPWNNMLEIGRTYCVFIQQSPNNIGLLWWSWWWCLLWQS